MELPLTLSSPFMPTADGVASLSVGSGDPSYINLTWRPPPPPNNDVIYYMVKTTPFGGGDVINSTNVSGLSADLSGFYGEFEW